jgi:hypothetical protein
MSPCAFAVEMLRPSFIKSMEKDLKLQNTVNLCVHQFDATRSAIAEMSRNYRIFVWIQQNLAPKNRGLRLHRSKKEFDVS